MVRMVSVSLSWPDTLLYKQIAHVKGNVEFKLINALFRVYSALLISCMRFGAVEFMFILCVCDFFGCPSIFNDYS